MEKEKVNLRRPILNAEGTEIVGYKRFKAQKAIWDKIQKQRRDKDPLNPVPRSWEDVEVDTSEAEAAKAKAEAEAAKAEAEAAKAEAEAAKLAEEEAARKAKEEAEAKAKAGKPGNATA